uniref:diguanylate cyclase n=1 Tax=Candidatus Kentrum sp. TC TaxID=2126339 RepID=A0A450Y9U9_9GAMM|nr:MAG: diguanylate cyclase (GGDEF) domain-containing protein [Candidatus Kentron sp. TC]
MAFEAPPIPKGRVLRAMDMIPSHNRVSANRHFRPIPRERRALERTQPVLLAIAGTSAGKLFPLREKSTFTIGRAGGCDICLPHPAISPWHARLEIDKKGHARITDLETAGGTYVNGVAVSRRAFADGAIIRIGPTDTLKFTYINRIEKYFHLDQYRKTIHDDLTGAFNRRYFQTALRQELAHARHHGRAVSLILIDIDRFKRINDSRGHPAGDAILQRVVRVIRENLPDKNILARYGGEEFGIILRGKDVEARASANRIRRSVARTAFDDAGEPLHITISVGTANYDGGASPKDASEMITQADRRLYRAKAAGGNRVFGEDSPFSLPHQTPP